MYASSVPVDTKAFDVGSLDFLEKDMDCSLLQLTTCLIKKDEGLKVFSPIGNTH